MIGRLKSISLRGRLLLASGLCVAVAMTVLIVIQTIKANAVIEKQVRAALEQLGSDMLLACRVQNDVISAKLGSDMEVFHLLADKSGLLQDNLAEIRDHSLVDQMKQKTGSLATVFVMTGQGMMRVSTNVQKKEGGRAVGTFITPESPVYQAVTAGRIYKGLATVVGVECLTQCDPISKDGKVIGALFVGIPTYAATSIKDISKEIKIGETGYPYVIDGKGHMVIHPKLEPGYNLGQFDFCKEMMEKKEGWTNYVWEGRSKIVRFVYFEPWDWIIVASTYEEEFYQGNRSLLYLSIASLAVLVPLTLALIYWFVIRYIQQRIRQTVDQTESGRRAAVEGRLDFRLNPDSVIPELRPIVTGMNQLLDAVIAPLREIADLLQRLAANDLTARMTGQYQGEFDSVKLAGNTLAESFQTAVKTIRDSTVLVAASSEELSAVATDVSMNAGQTSQQADAVSAASAQSAAQELSGVAATLQQLVNAFRVDEAVSSAATVRSGAGAGRWPAANALGGSFAPISAA